MPLMTAIELPSAGPPSTGPAELSTSVRAVHNPAAALAPPGGADQAQAMAASPSVDIPGLGIGGPTRRLARQPVRGTARAIAVLVTVVLVLTCPNHTTAAAPAWAATVAGAARAAATGFVLPVPPPPIVLTAFAPPANRYGPGHRGVDLAVTAGSEIRSAGTGIVVYAADLAGRGVVSIEHAGGLRTTYEPVTSSVTAGAAVRAGQVIGVLQAGHPGCAPADCLHWGARLPDRVYLDPMSLLTGWEVRLLPWADP